MSAPAGRRLVARCYREAARLNRRAHRRERLARTPAFADVQAAAKAAAREDRRLAALLAHAARAMEG